MEFEVGGSRLYAMCGPNGEKHWALADYLFITPQTIFKHRDGFCDSAGNLSPDSHRSDWNVNFAAAGDSTIVNVFIQYESLTSLQKVMEMGFKEGFTIALVGLEEILSTTKK